MLLEIEFHPPPLEIFPGKSQVTFFEAACGTRSGEIENASRWAFITYLAGNFQNELSIVAPY